MWLNNNYFLPKLRRMLILIISYRAYIKDTYLQMIIAFKYIYEKNKSRSCSFPMWQLHIFDKICISNEIIANLITYFYVYFNKITANLITYFTYIEYLNKQSKLFLVFSSLAPISIIYEMQLRMVFLLSIKR